MNKTETMDSLEVAVLRATGCDLLPVSRHTQAGAVMDRPTLDECHTFHFAQATDGAAETFTTVVVGPERDACVYFDGQFAYRLHNPDRTFFDDLARRTLRRVDHRSYESYLH